MKRLLLSFLLTVSFILSNGCNLTYKVRNQHSNIEEIINIPCGKINVELIGRGNSKFVFKQKFNLDETSYVYIDSLKILYNDFAITPVNNLKNRTNSGCGIEINGKGSWESSFELEKGVFEGDTIKIFGSQYLQCKGQNITLDTLVYTFINNLRIQGVNDF